MIKNKNVGDHDHQRFFYRSLKNIYNFIEIPSKVHQKRKGIALRHSTNTLSIQFGRDVD